MGAIGRAWTRYRGRKTRKGIVVDFVFLAVVLTMAITPLRRSVMTYALRCIISQPEAFKPIVFMGGKDSIAARTADGRDTTLHFPPLRPAVLNSASVWSAQSRAEMRSLDEAAGLWPDIDFYILTDEDEAQDMARYLTRKKYRHLRLLTFAPSGRQEGDDAECTAIGAANDLRQNIPATIAVKTDGRVAIRKLGAAKWTGKRISEIYKQLTDSQ